MSANVVDSSAWLEYFGGGDRAHLFATAIRDTQNLVVPVITIYEVFKKVLRERDENHALQAASTMMTGKVVDLDLSLVLAAAYYKLPMADSIIYATAERYGATLWTQDEDFETLPNVRFFAR
jgi:predicted nucleic acid-binding protein